MKPAWYAIAEEEASQHIAEVPGPAANPRIVEYHAATWLRATSDEVPWCSSFVGWCMAKAGLTPTRSAAAHSWATWGEVSGPRLGAIMVIQHKQKGADAATGSSSGYHVAFWAAQDEHSWTLLGGNQGDAVRLSHLPRSDYTLVACRWPAEAPLT